MSRYRRAADWRLRAGLLLALTALVGGCWSISPSHPVEEAVTAGPPASTGLDVPGEALPSAPLPISTEPVGSSRNTAATGPADGCGFSTTPGARRRPVGQCTVVEIGDSLGNDLGWGLAREVAPGAGVHLVQLDRSSSGLVNVGFYDWPTALASALREYHPELVLVCLGGNDQQGMRLPGGAVQFPSPPWQEAYLGRVRALIREAAGQGAYVLWVGLPIMRQYAYSRGVQILNRIYQQAAGQVPAAVFTPTWGLFSDPHGLYESNAVVSGVGVTLRQPDGIHLTLAGEDVAATYVLGQLAASFHVQISPARPAVIAGWG
jgi:hypothetical protein